jgi:hypothetical protein
LRELKTTEEKAKADLEISVGEKAVALTATNLSKALRERARVCIYDEYEDIVAHVWDLPHNPQTPPSPTKVVKKRRRRTTA